MLAALWFTGAVTAILAVGAGITAWFAFKTYGAQSRQLSDQQAVNSKLAEVLPLQKEELEASLAERKREAAEREHAAADLRRAQASRVFLRQEFRSPGSGLPGPAGQATAMEARERGIRGTVWVIVVNTSEQPVYGLEIRWHRGTAPWDQPENGRQLMPGESAEFSRALPPGLPASVETALFGAVARFRDAAGITWLRRAAGELIELQ